MKKIFVLLLIPFFFISCANPFADHTYTVINNSTKTVSFVLARETNKVTLAPSESVSLSVGCFSPRIDFENNPRVGVKRSGNDITIIDLTPIETYVINENPTSITLTESNGMIDEISVPANTLSSAPLKISCFTTTPSFSAVTPNGTSVSVKTTYDKTVLYVAISLW